MNPYATSHLKRTVLVLFTGALISAHGIAVQDYATAEQPPAGFDWNHVLNYKGSSAVAVDPYWILTAAHVADDSGTGALSIGGTTYTQQEIVYHDTADLALVRYDKALPGYYALYTGALTPQRPIDPNYTVILAGFGTTGTVTADAWTDSGTGRGTLRWGDQEIDRTATASYNVGGTVGDTTNTGFWMDFNLANTPYEAGVGIGDSGGGSFIDDGGTWKLAGINTIRSGTESGYTATFSIAVGDYEPWISQTIPEPAAAGLIALFGLGSLAVHRFFC